MDLVSAYSKRLDLADTLVRAVEQIERAQARADTGPVVDAISVQLVTKSDRPWRIVDRLTEADMRLLVVAFEAGTPKWKLAEQYGISESSVKRMVRRHRTQA